MAVVTVLDFAKWRISRCANVNNGHYNWPAQFCLYITNCSRDIAFTENSRWRPPPCWISPKVNSYLKTNVQSIGKYGQQMEMKLHSEYSSWRFSLSVTHSLCGHQLWHTRMRRIAPAAGIVRKLQKVWSTDEVSEKTKSVSVSVSCAITFVLFHLLLKAKGHKGHLHRSKNY